MTERSGDPVAGPAGTPVEPHGSGPQAGHHPRLIGRLTSSPGPRLILVAGMHGNEPAGVTAALSVLNQLRRDDIAVRGDLVALRGNVRALDARKRYLEEDLNRLWTEDRVAALRGARSRPGVPPDASPERAEQAELLVDLDPLIVESPGEVVVVDLHSTSGPGAPFACISDTLRSRAIALTLPIPLVLGIEEAIHGTLLEHLETEGVPMVLLEGGRHDAPETADNLESAIWLVLSAIGMIDADSAAIHKHAERLSAAARGLPAVVEVRYRHHLEEADAFRMREGLSHFQRVRRGQPLADDDHGTISSPANGLLIMPRYQVQGSDGFFIGRAVRRSWLDVSRWARALRIDRLLPRMPGVTVDPARPQRLRVDPAIARWFTIQLFHLSGFRKLPDRGDRLIFTRRIEP